MKIALCFIISYEHVLNKEQLWIDWIKPNQDIINIYFHYKDINKIIPISKLYEKCDPHLIYTFGNEINIVVNYNDQGNYVFDGNINKTITYLCSLASVEVSKMLLKHDIDIDVYFTGQFVEFDIEYEVLNYIIWRQMDCKRNTLTLLYKCLNMGLILDGKINVDGMNIEDMISIMNEKQVLDVTKTYNHLLVGNLIKKHVFYIEKKKTDLVDDDSKIVSRRCLNIEHVKLSDNFKENYQKYIVNKLC